jgi:hypothetical protein
LEPVLPFDYPAPSSIDCRTLRHSQVVATTLLRIRCAMRTLCNEPCFHIMDL